MRAYERLIRYAAYPTASDESCPDCPSTPAQLTFARALADEMQSLGIADANVDENGYVFGTIQSALSRTWTWWTRCRLKIFARA